MMEISNIVVTLLLLLIHNNKAQTTEEWSSAEPDQNMKAQVTSDFRVGLPKVMCYVWSKTVLCNYSFPFKESLNQEETEEQKRVRLLIFPKSIFPSLPEEDDDE